MNDLATMRHELLALRKRFFNGEPVQTEMNALAQRCADVYNAKAREVANKHGMSPKLTTAAKILRQGEFLR